jgi:hypothetical protein
MVELLRWPYGLLDSHRRALPPESAEILAQTRRLVCIISIALNWNPGRRHPDVKLIVNPLYGCAIKAIYELTDAGYIGHHSRFRTAKNAIKILHRLTYFSAGAPFSSLDANAR